MSSSKIVKCTTCNIVISELLAFVQNKLDVMDNESLINICATSFSTEDIDQAKSLLFESLSAGKRKISRRRDKRHKDLEDIIALFKNTDPELIPIFVAKELCKLPPVTFDHIDVTGLLKDLLLLKNELKDIKNNYATVKQLQEIKSELHNCKYGSIVGIEDYNVNKCRRGAFSSDSGPVGLSPVLERIKPINESTQRARCSGSTPRVLSPSLLRSADDSASEIGEIERDTELLSAAPGGKPCVFVSSKLLSQTAELHVPPVRALPVCSTTEPNEISNKRLTLSEIVQKNGDFKIDEPNSSWITVQRKRLRNRFVSQLGKATTEPLSNFKAADIKVPLFVSNVHKDTEESDITEYIYNKTQERVRLTKIKMKYDKGYNAFKLFVSQCRMHLYLDDNLWPDGIKFRRFVNMRVPDEQYFNGSQSK